MRLTLRVNAAAVEAEIQPGETLLRLLRRHGFWSVKYGCDTGDCGACTVLADGVPVLACLYPAVRAATQELTTVEALGHTDALHPLQRAFLEHGAAQCGYCTPAMLLVAHALLQREPSPDAEAIRAALAGVLCRCTGYLKPVEAIQACAGPRGTAATRSVTPAARTIAARDESGEGHEHTA